jgi:hypothetical protein
VVRIHAGEPTFSFNNLEVDYRSRVQILYRRPQALHPNALTRLQKLASMDSRLDSMPERKPACGEAAPSNVVSACNCFGGMTVAKMASA